METGQSHNTREHEEGSDGWRERLERAGMLGDLFGIQFDLNAAWREQSGELTGASFCDHNCTTEAGNYNCLAATTLNGGIQPKSLAPASAVIRAFDTLGSGIEMAKAEFFSGAFQAYCDALHIPADAAVAMEEAFRQPGYEVNLFGGNPELHPEVTTIIAALRNAGHRVHLTTTGGRFMRDRRFLDEIIAHPPSLIALSADDFENGDDIRALAAMTADELKAAWKQVPRIHGQRRKAIEAVYAAKLAAETDGFPPILFNMVLHNGNIGVAHDIIGALTDTFPGVRVNPFPAQSAFYYGEDAALAAEHAGKLRDFADHMIHAQAASLNGEGASPYVPRLHYWLMLRAVFDWAGNDGTRAMDMICGNGIWQCYRAAPAGFYLQAGLGPDGEIRGDARQLPGGHLGCFWNRQTVTDSGQLWDESMKPPAVARYIQVGKTTLAAASAKPCPGCAFPRLTGHIISTESGIDQRILPFYLVRRQTVLGF